MELAPRKDLLLRITHGASVFDVPASSEVQFLKLKISYFFLLVQILSSLQDLLSTVKEYIETNHKIPARHQTVKLPSKIIHSITQSEYTFSYSFAASL
jgi:hypothetical protein